MIENPILKGFSPDPSIIRVGEDYYIAVSTFEWWPGVKLYHSRDLKHWEQIPSPLRRMSQLNMIGNPASGGVWAPCLSYDGKRFYLIYTDVKTKKGRYYNNHNYLVSTDDIYGDWSEPIYLNSTGFDPSLFHDKDGKKYLVNMKNGFKGILLQEYDPEKQCLVGESKNIFQGTEHGFTEGPHIYFVNGYYYLMVAEGGTGYGHCVTVARSKSIWGPYEIDPDNPMLTSKEDDQAYLQKCGHADITDTQNGEWYMVHLCSRPRTGNRKCLLGRETAIQKVYWNEAGWLRLANEQRGAVRFVEEPKGILEMPFPLISAKDDFHGEELDLRYVSPRIPIGANADLRARKGYLRLYGQESLNSLHHVSLLAVKQEEVNGEAETQMEFLPEYEEQLAGLAYMYDAMNFYILGKTVDEAGNDMITLIKSDTGIVETLSSVVLPQAAILFLKVKTSKDGKWAEFYYSTDQADWIKVGDSCDTDILTDEHCRGFTGAHFGMYCHDMTGKRLYADFGCFEYRIFV